MHDKHCHEKAMVAQDLGERGGGVSAQHLSLSAGKEIESAKVAVG